MLKLYQLKKELGVNTMFNKAILKEVLVNYKKNFIDIWGQEKYKWEAIKHFQDNWDVKTEDFVDMLSLSLEKTYNLLASSNYFPARMIRLLAEKAPEQVREMFVNLFDEGQDVTKRIAAFKQQSAEINKKYAVGKQHFQYESATSTYLWLHYPDKYYIYKYSEVKAVAKMLDSDYTFKKGAYVDNIRNSILFYNEISKELKNDLELVGLLASQLTNSCYPDPDLRTLTIDVGFYISRDFAKKVEVEIEESEEWFPSDYSPELSADDWISLLQDKSVFNKSSLEIVKRLKDFGGMATCTQLAAKYGETKNFYNRGSSALAQRIAKKTGCTVMPRDSSQSRWWPILYVGKWAGREDEGSYIWKLRDELAQALEKVDLSDVALFADSKGTEEESNYWWIVANPKIWSFTSLPIGEEQFYTLYNAAGNKHRIFQNFLDAKVGDMVIGYESAPVKKIVAIGRISAEQDGANIGIEKIEGLSSPIDYSSLRDCEELKDMEFLHNMQGSIFKLTKDEYEFIIDLIREENLPETDAPIDKYAKTDFLNEVYISEEYYEELKYVLLEKKNIILQGAPGVGKTFSVERLIYSILGEKDDNKISFIQFHQNYCYEDLMLGYRPSDSGFEKKYGHFYRSCRKAMNHPDKKFFFIIDEINRGNISKIFGELLMAIEKDYRGKEITLAGDEIRFSVPKNLYIIGLMNTADRSLAIIDYALRRRFSFFTLEPAFDSKGFKAYQQSLNNNTFDNLILKIKELNNEIADDRALGKGFCIGHSYFCNLDDCTDKKLKVIVNYEILPMLREYWFDDSTKVQRWESVLNNVLL